MDGDSEKTGDLMKVDIDEVNKTPPGDQAGGDHTHIPKIIGQAKNLNLERYDTELAAVIADSVKEHDDLDAEVAEAFKIKVEHEAELAENDGWIKILGNDDLMKKTLSEGILNKRPTRGDLCAIRVVGKLKNDESVTFETHDCLNFHLGDAEVIIGLDLAIPLMCKRETALVQIASRFAYGAKGLPPWIPGDAPLLYEVELLNFEGERYPEELSIHERRDVGNRKRERGNWWYSRGESSLAVQCYRRALEYFDLDEGGAVLPNGTNDPKALVKELFEDRLKTHNNMAAAQMKLQAYGSALMSVDFVLQCQPNNVKALYRKAKILRAKGSTDKALKCLEKAANLEPDNTAVQQEMRQLQDKKKVEHQNEKQLYRRMFKDNSTTNKTEAGKSDYIRSLSVGLVCGGLAIALAGIMAYRYRLI